MFQELGWLLINKRFFSPFTTGLAQQNILEDYLLPAAFGAFILFSVALFLHDRWFLAVLAARGESRSYEGSTQSIRRTTLTRMAMGTRETDQPPLWIATSDLPTSPGHPFYARLTTLLDGHHFDRFVEGLCDRFYAPVMGRPSLAPGRYFRLLLVGYFEGIDSERGMAWRATDSLAVRSFLRLAVDEAPPDHSTMARTRRLIDLETHRTVFTWVSVSNSSSGRRWKLDHAPAVGDPTHMVEFGTGRRAFAREA